MKLNIPQIMIRLSEQGLSTKPMFGPPMKGILQNSYHNDQETSTALCLAYVTCINIHGRIIDNGSGSILISLLVAYYSLIGAN